MTLASPATTAAAGAADRRRRSRLVALRDAVHPGHRRRRKDGQRAARAGSSPRWASRRSSPWSRPSARVARSWGLSSRASRSIDAPVRTCRTTTTALAGGGPRGQARGGRGGVPGPRRRRGAPGAVDRGRASPPAARDGARRAAVGRAGHAQHARPWSARGSPRSRGVARDLGRPGLGRGRHGARRHRGPAARAAPRSGDGPLGLGSGVLLLGGRGAHRGGRADGPDRETSSRTLVVETMLGSAKLLARDRRGARGAARQVTSPAGTTAAGLRALESRAVRSAFMEAVAGGDRAVPLTASLTGSSSSEIAPSSSSSDYGLAGRVRRRGPRRRCAPAAPGVPSST